MNMEQGTTNAEMEPFAVRNSVFGVLRFTWFESIVPIL